MKLLVATSNAGKIREISRILEGLPIELVSLADFKDIKPAIESGNSFLANARIKTGTYYRQTGLPTLAEDSGLQVDHLSGQPGCLSARFAGDDATDAENVAKLLRLMRDAKGEQRRARFVCVVAITDGKRIWIATGKCGGRIATRRLGRSGFGYDPIFIPEGHQATFARLGTKTKNEISHRAMAFKKVRSILERLLAERSKTNESIRAKSKCAGS
jgi:XTP/dITP diphosphohydrolase